MLKSVRYDTHLDWLAGTFGAGVAFGCADTKGILSVHYEQPIITFAGGNGSAPVWNMSLTGSSGYSYNLNEINNRLPFSGGIMSGNIYMGEETAIGANSPGIIFSGSSDGADIYYHVEASDQGQLVINLRDDANASLVFSNLNSPFAYLNASGFYPATNTTMEIGMAGADFAKSFIRQQYSQYLDGTLEGGLDGALCLQHNRPDKPLYLCGVINAMDWFYSHGTTKILRNQYPQLAFSSGSNKDLGLIFINTDSGDYGDLYLRRYLADDGSFVTACLQVNGRFWASDGFDGNLYGTASNANALNNYEETNFFRTHRGGATAVTGEGTLWSSAGTKQYNGSFPDGLVSDYGWGEVISLPSSDSRFEIWSAHNSSDTGNFFMRSGWDTDVKAWVKILTSVTGVEKSAFSYSNGTLTITV